MAKRTGPKPRAGETAVSRLELRLTAEERERWQVAAARECLSLSEYVRAAVERTIGRP